MLWAQADIDVLQTRKNKVRRGTVNVQRKLKQSPAATCDGGWSCVCRRKKADSLLPPCPFHIQKPFPELPHTEGLLDFPLTATLTHRLHYSPHFFVCWQPPQISHDMSGVPRTHPRPMRGGPP